MQDFQLFIMQRVYFVSCTYYMSLTLTFMGCGQHYGGSRDSSVVEAFHLLGR